MFTNGVEVGRSYSLIAATYAAWMLEAYGIEDELDGDDVVTVDKVFTTTAGEQCALVTGEQFFRYPFLLTTLARILIPVEE